MAVNSHLKSRGQTKEGKVFIGKLFWPFPCVSLCSQRECELKISGRDKWGLWWQWVPICSSLRCRSRPYDWQIHPPCSATQQIHHRLHHKYTNCVIQIHWLWCTNPELWGTNLGKWIRLMKTPTTKHMKPPQFHYNHLFSTNIVMLQFQVCKNEGSQFFYI